jgi:Protein of unknown function (DUF3768)
VHRDRSKIIELNDRFRSTFKGGRVQMSRSVYELEPRLRGRALWVLSKYKKFDPDSEHDWGTFIFGGYAFEWWIEYRSTAGLDQSPDPANPDMTFRVLTLEVVADILR